MPRDAGTFSQGITCGRASVAGAGTLRPHHGLTPAQPRNRERAGSRIYEPVVLRVCTDPNPRDRIFTDAAYSPVMLSDANAKSIRASMQPSEMEQWMGRVLAPQSIGLEGEFLDLAGEPVKQGPEASGGDGSQQAAYLDGGQFRARPCSFSDSASWNRKSSLPAAESSSICSSQEASSRARNHSARRRYWSGGRPSIAASISSTRSIPGV